MKQAPTITLLMVLIVLQLFEKGVQVVQVGELAVVVYVALLQYDAFKRVSKWWKDGLKRAKRRKELYDAFVRAEKANEWR